MSLSSPLPSSLSTSLALSTIPVSIFSSSPTSTLVPSSSPSRTSTTFTPSTPSASTSAPSSSFSTQPLASPTPPSSNAPSSTLPSSTLSSTSSSLVSAAIVQPSSSWAPTTLSTGGVAPFPDSSSSVLVLSSLAATPSTTSQSSSPGFFSDTAAVAGTFTVVGLVGIAGIIAVALFFARRRHSRSYEEDTEFLDRTPDISADPPMTQVTSLDDVSSSDHTHFGAPPMVLATPPAVYYPDHAHALHPQAFQAESLPLPLPHAYPAAYTHHYPANHVYSPEDYDIAYPPSGPHGDPNMPNPHDFSSPVEIPPPAPPAQTVPPDALRPSVKSTSTTPMQWENTRFSVDSFYSGIATDIPVSPGQAL